MKRKAGAGLRLRFAFGDMSFLRHVIALMTGTAAAQVVVVLLMPLLSRLYTPVEFGILASFSSVVAIVTAVATLKYDMAIMLPSQDDSAIILRRTVFWISFIICTIVTVGLLFIAPWIAEVINSPQTAPWLVLAGVAALTLTEISALSYWLNRKSRYREMASNRVLQSGSTALVQLGLGFIQPLGAGGLIIGTIVGQLLSVLRLRVKTPELRRGPKLKLKQRLRLLRRYRQMPLLNAPTALVDAIRVNGINLLIAAVSVGALGQFSMAWRMIQVPAALISGALAQVFFQRLSVVEPGEMLRAVRSNVLRSVAFGIIPFALIFVLSPWLFPFVFGEEWQDAGRYAQALVPWLFMNLITSPISTLFIVVERQMLSLIFAIAFTAVPFAVILLTPGSIMTAVFVMGGAMALMLLVYVFLAMWVAKSFDERGQLSEGI